ncbi:MAG: hypothetical protein ABWK00_06895 [Desulfurococcaceae archaeon]
MGGLVKDRKIVYEDDEVVVALAPRDDELPDMVLEAIKNKGRPVFFEELVSEFSGLAGEDRVRKAVYNLVLKGLVIEFPDGSLGTTDMKWEFRGIKKRRRFKYVSESLMRSSSYLLPEH